MDTKTNKIVIVGGGTAGWMTASTLIKAHPNKEIVLLESPTIPTIGVGEAGLPEMNYWVDFLGLDWDELFIESEAVWKIAGKFVDFHEIGKDFYIPTFYTDAKDFFETSNVIGIAEWNYKKLMEPDLDYLDFYRYHFPQYQLLINNSFTRDESPNLFPFQPKRHGALHVNAIKFAEYLRDKYAKPRGVKHIVGTVKEIIGREDGGVGYLILEDDSILEGDIYVDCTGFKSLLLGGFLKEPFESTLDILPHNRAFFAPVEYTDKNIELESMTTSFALGNGWAWNTPIWSRIGTGYAWSDEFTDEESALQEFKDHLDSKNMKVYDPERSKKTTIRSVNVKNGYYERSFVKNVVAIGLSAGFMDPLEGSGLLFIMNGATAFSKYLSRKMITKFDRDVYNAYLDDLIEMYKQFLTMHFALTIRGDTPYWKKWRERPISKILIKDTFKADQDRTWDKIGSSRLCVLYGHDYPIINAFTPYCPELKRSADDKMLEKTLTMSFNRREEIIARWETEAKKLPTQYEYLKKRLYDR
jgi:tryptophan halogenase